jgi:hypothetical protein
MKVWLVFRNEKIESVFYTKETAEIFVKAYGGWNTWKIVEKDVI